LRAGEGGHAPIFALMRPAASSLPASGGLSQRFRAGADDQSAHATLLSERPKG
jgi:hypothetical protein